MTAAQSQSDFPDVPWQAVSTHPELVEALREKLREVIDPELGLNIIELGLIRDFRVTEGQAELTLILTTPFCPYAPAMIEMTRTKAEEALNVPVAVELGMEMWDPTMMEQGAGADWGLF